MAFEEKILACYILLTDQISYSDCLHILRHWEICLLKLIVNQVVTSKLWNWPYLSNQAIRSTWPKSQEKNLNILRTKRAFEKKRKVFFIIFEGLPLDQGKKTTRVTTRVQHKTKRHNTSATRVQHDPPWDITRQHKNNTIQHE